MSKIYLLSLTIFIFFGLPAVTMGQEANSFHLNADNGLPSNHVYGMITDRHGYLWISTDKGVVRYNGYDCKLFTVADGLPTDDVWQVLEDRKGRLWLGCNTDEVGYILHGKYHKTPVKDMTGIIYKAQMAIKDDGIVFYRADELNEYRRFCILKNDTIHSLLLTDKIDKTVMHRNGFTDLGVLLCDEQGNPIILYGGYFFRFDIKQDASINNKLVATSTLISVAKADSEIHYHEYINQLLGDFMLSTPLKHRKYDLLLTSLKTGDIKRMNLDLSPGDYITRVYYERDTARSKTCFFITNKCIFKCRADSVFSIEHKYKIEDFVADSNIMKTKINAVHYSKFWNYCMGSISDGIWVNYSTQSHFKRTKIALKNYAYVGRYKDSMSFWWNGEISRLAVLYKNDKVKYYNTGNIISLKQIIHFSDDSFFVAAAFPSYFINNTGKFTIWDDRGSGVSINSAILKNNKQMLLTSIFGVYTYTIASGKKEFHDLDRFSGIHYDSLRGQYWTFHRGKVFILKDSTEDDIPKARLNELGIKGLESMCIDNTYGNVFLKGYDNFAMYDHEEKIGKPLFENFIFDREATIMTHGGLLIVVWKHGILFSKIVGKMNTTQPIWYANPKGIVYKNIYGCLAINSKVIINTDKGIYEVDIPTEEQIIAGSKSLKNDYKFIINYADSVTFLKSSDTLAIDQTNRILLFDVINPSGNGKIKYHYSYYSDSDFKVLNSNEINVSETFQPDEYYKLYVYASDDSWKSDIVELNLYIKPYWWQTHSAKRLIWVSSILLCLVLFVIAILVTRKIVLSASARKHDRMEMEIKSIHAQINPHFIFNTLNSALLMVSKNRMEEAYAHISKFSKLLRSYLKSSRNKYIKVEDEIENLKNYIELQQTRFKDKFEYKITTDSAIAGRSVLIPSLLIQPFVENAINHGILQKEGVCFLKIEFVAMKAENIIVCIIEDNGIGRKQSKLNKLSDQQRTESYGDLLISDLVNIFNKYEDMHIDIAYTDKELPETGTIVTITIKNPKHE